MRTFRRPPLGSGAAWDTSPHATAPLPTPADDWRDWFRENTRGFRRTLLLRRDGARLHAGSSPGGTDLDRIAHKMAFLTAAGVPEEHARTAMLAAGRFTVGRVLEEQADTGPGDGDGDGDGGDRTAAGPPDLPPDVGPTDHESSFEAGLALILEGLEQQVRGAR
ncbi:TetR/AcrR family tetracycline transcriptional repressor [Streptomyces tendae]|uniref:TetR/AcrR family transcriptional regulator C-terminal domain-containing protein n=1 Tax=Streptomyces tendae TaxID=1932 RepID=UPI00383793D6